MRVRVVFLGRRIKKGEDEGKKCHTHTMMSKKTDKTFK
jgi:hypothetical protein